MNKKLLSLFLFLMSVTAFSQAPEHDTQVWHETTVTFSPCKEVNCNIGFLKKFSGFVAGTFRAGRNVSHPVDERIGAGVEMKFKKYLTFSPWYLYRAGQPYAGRKEYEHRIRLDATIENDSKTSWKEFSIKNRNRFEFRLRHNQENSVRYRNKTTVKIPVKKIKDKEDENKTKVTFSPFIADEPFYDFSANSWTRNEFSAGLIIDFSGKYFGAKNDKKISTEFFYLLQNNRGTSFKSINVFGAYLKIDLSKKEK